MIPGAHTQYAGSTEEGASHFFGRLCLHKWGCLWHVMERMNRNFLWWHNRYVHFRQMAKWNKNQRHYGDWNETNMINNQQVNMNEVQVRDWKWVVGDGAGVRDRKSHITSLLFRYGSWTSKARQTIKELNHQKKNSYIYIPIYSSQLGFPFFPKWTYMFEMTHKKLYYSNSIQQITLHTLSFQFCLEYGLAGFYI